MKISPSLLILLIQSFIFGCVLGQEVDPAENFLLGLILITLNLGLVLTYGFVTSIKSMDELLKNTNDPEE